MNIELRKANHSFGRKKKTMISFSFCLQGDWTWHQPQNMSIVQSAGYVWGMLNHKQRKRRNSTT